MSEQFRSLLEQSMQLSRQERWELIQTIIEQAERAELEVEGDASMPNDHYELTQIQKTELEERTRQRHQGKMQTYSWDEVKQGLKGG